MTQFIGRSLGDGKPLSRPCTNAPSAAPSTTTSPRRWRVSRTPRLIDDDGEHLTMSALGTLVYDR